MITIEPYEDSFVLLLFFSTNTTAIYLMKKFNTLSIDPLVLTGFVLSSITYFRYQISPAVTANPTDHRLIVYLWLNASFIFCYEKILTANPAIHQSWQLTILPSTPAPLSSKNETSHFWLPKWSLTTAIRSSSLLTYNMQSSQCLEEMPCYRSEDSFKMEWYTQTWTREKWSGLAVHTVYGLRDNWSQLLLCLKSNHGINKETWLS